MFLMPVLSKSIAKQTVVIPSKNARNDYTLNFFSCRLITVKPDQQGRRMGLHLLSVDRHTDQH